MAEISFRPARVPTNDSNSSVTTVPEPAKPSAKPPAAPAADDGMITVRAHNTKPGAITVMRVKRGTPMREVMASYASNKGVKAERLSWKRRSSANGSPTARDGSVVVSPKSEDEEGECGLPACGCTGFS